MNSTNSYNDIAKIFKQVNSVLLQYCSEHAESRLAKNFLGVQILLSPLIIKPKFLLIGINPGPGYYNQCGERVAEFEPLRQIEYANYGYPLAKNTRSYFEKAGMLDCLLTSTVKTNFHYYATSGKTTLDQLIVDICNCIQIDGFDPDTLAMESTKNIIELVDPEYIVCEGKSVIASLQKSLQSKCRYLRRGNVDVIKIANYKVIAYKRQFSRIHCIDEIAKVLKEEVA